ncbi:restriction endonuclease subunit S [Anaerococcus urinomassiliensis]|uniref:restriction endonuclease subunit S n=1 Tax=Anaerococcus urinomassiliensis TaxID=1745712 RepID=UPI000938CD12|nr:restriction endonuclease subunit S [Anaerococcus urinomassiliensis]
MRYLITGSGLGWGDYVTLINGDRSSNYPKKSDLVTEGVPFFGAADMTSDKLDFRNVRFISENKFHTLNSGKLEDYDLVTLLRGTVGKTSLFRKNNEFVTGFINAQMVILRELIKTDCSVLYLKFFLNSTYFINFSDKYKSGTAVSQMPATTLRNVLFPLPPLAEQERIVEKIEDAFELLDEIEAAQDQITSLGEQIKSKVLDMAIGGQLSEQNSSKEYIKPKVAVDNSEKYLNIPKHRTWIRVEDLGEIQTGNTPKKSQPENYGLELPFIKPSNINNLEMDYNTDEFLSDIGKKKGRIVEDNSILVTCIGNLGRAAIVDKEVAFNQQINSITPNEFVDSKLILYFITSNKFYNQMIKKSSTVTVRLLNKTSFSSIPFPLPPLGEQKRIVEKIEEIFAAVEAMIE